MGCVTACHHVLACARKQVVCLYEAAVMKASAAQASATGLFFPPFLMSSLAWPQKLQSDLGIR